MSTETHLTTPGHKTTADHDLAFYDGKFMPLSEANVNVSAHALHYGSGCFEGLRGYWVDEDEELYILKLSEHVDRFFRSCNVLRIRPPFTPAEMEDYVLTLVRENDYRSDVYIRPLAFKASQTIKLTLSSLADSFAIFAFPFGHYAHRDGGTSSLLFPMAPNRGHDDSHPGKSDGRLHQCCAGLRRCRPGGL